MKPKDPRLYWYLEKLEELRDNPKAKVIDLSKEEFLEHVDFLFGPVFDDEGKTLFIEDFRYVYFAIEKILEIDLRKFLQASNVPQEIIQAAEEFGGKDRADDARLIAKNKVNQFITKQEQLKTANIAQAQEDISQKAQAIVKASLPGSLARNPEVVKKLATVVENEVLAGYLETILPEDLSPQVLQKVTQHIIETADLPEQLVQAEPSLPPNVAQLVKANLKNLTWSPQTTATIKEINQTGFVLPRGLREKMPTAGGPPSLLKAFGSPHLFFEKVILSPIAKTAETISKAGLDNEEALIQGIKRLRADPRAKPQDVLAWEWQLFESSRFRTKNKIFSFFTGLSKDGLEQFKIHLTVARGLGPTDFRVRYIDNQIEKMAMLEQRSRLARFYDRYLRSNRRAGLVQPRFQLGQREYYLPRSRPVSGFSQRVIDSGESIGYYRQFVEYPGVKVIRSIPLKKFADFRSFIFRKTLKLVFTRLGKTAIGKAFKSGIRTIISKGFKKAITKGITTLITKLGIKGLASAIGTAIAPGVGTAIGLVVGFVIDKAKDILSKFKQLITRPEYAVGMGIVGGIFVIGVPGTIGIAIGAPLLALSGIGLVTSAGGILGSAAAATVAALSVFFAPLAVPIAAFVISLIISLMVITLFIVFLIASAFIIPASPEELAEKASVYLRVTKEASQYRIENDELQNNPTVSYTIRITAAQPIRITQIRDKRTVNCDPGNTNNPQVETPIDIPLPPSPIKRWKWPDDDSYQLTFGPGFEDCRVCNTVTVIGNVVDGPTGERSSHTACVKIGNPPEDCPEGWPTARGYITQGPNTSDSHTGKEAIDVGVPVGTLVYATHEGEVVEPAGWRDLAVAIRGECNGQKFFSFYTHLRTRAVRPGDHPSRGTLIGTSGLTSGYPGAGAHLHYEFTSLEMAWPYVGTDPSLDDILEGCVGGAACANPYSQW